jgi:hypothetical protein
LANCCSTWSASNADPSGNTSFSAISSSLPDR